MIGVGVSGLRWLSACWVCREGCANGGQLSVHCRELGRAGVVRSGGCLGVTAYSFQNRHRRKEPRESQGQMKWHGRVTWER